MYTPTDDELLVRKVCANDPAAIEELFMVRCGGMIVALSRRFGYDDLFGDFYLLLLDKDWRRLRTWDKSGPLAGWLRSVAIRLCLARARRENRLVFADPQSIEGLLEHGADPHDAHSRRIDLLRAIARLKDPRQRYLIRGLLEGRAVETLAEELKITRAHADVLKSRAVAELKVLLCANGTDQGRDDDE